MSKEMGKVLEMAQEQSVPTKADIMVAFNEAIQNNSNRKEKYKPNFKLSAEYEKLQNELECLKGKEPYDSMKADALSEEMLRIQLQGTIERAVLDLEVDKTLEMSIDSIFKEYHRYEEIIADCEEKIDNFNISVVQAEADQITSEYERKAKGKQAVTRAQIKEECETELDRLEYEKIKKPLNDLKIKRWEAVQFFTVYDSRIKFYMVANKERIDAEIEAAKREEVRNSLAELVAYRGEE